MWFDLLFGNSLVLKECVWEKFRRKFARVTFPSNTVAHKLFNKVSATGSLLDKKHFTKCRAGQIAARLREHVRVILPPCDFYIWGGLEINCAEQIPIGGKVKRDYTEKMLRGYLCPLKNVEGACLCIAAKFWVLDHCTGLKLSSLQILLAFMKWVLRTIFALERETTRGLWKLVWTADS
jgi:hypothetical protein